MTEVHDIVSYWKKQKKADGKWIHPKDENSLRQPNSFNLDYPVLPYVGDIVNSPIIILAANGGYDRETTPLEFRDKSAVADSLDLVASPSTSDWSKYRAMKLYYENTNYGELIVKKQAALINACAYRSRKISEEEDNKKLIKTLPSCIFTRRWLIDCILPLARSGDRLVIGKRYGQWNLSDRDKRTDGVVLDPAPISPRISRKIWVRLEEFLSSRT